MMRECKSSTSLVEHLSTSLCGVCVGVGGLPVTFVGCLPFVDVVVVVFAVNRVVCSK